MKSRLLSLLLIAQGVDDCLHFRSWILIVFTESCEMATGTSCHIPSVKTVLVQRSNAIVLGFVLRLDSVTSDEFTPEMKVATSYFHVTNCLPMSGVRSILVLFE